MPNTKNRNIDTPNDDGKGSIVLELHISPTDLEELNEVLIRGNIIRASSVADQFIKTFNAVLEHAAKTMNDLDAQFYDDFMSLIGPKTIN
jgi:hypothetical protein